MNYLENCFNKEPNIVSRKIADDVILVPIRQNVGDLESIYTLNEVGAFIWELINGKRQVKEIKEIIVDEFEVSEEEAEKDLIEFLLKLEKMGGVK
jgi:hypothetical protein